MPKILLTDLAVRKIEPPHKGQRSYWDESLPGFGVRVSQGGAKTWIVLGPSSKDRTKETIGRYPVISLQDARGEAKRRLAEATLGKYRPRSVTWDAALDSYLKEQKKRRKARTHAEYKRLLEKYFRFGTTKVSALAPNDLHKKLEKIQALSERRHAYVVLRAFLNWCEGKHYLEDNPVRRVKVEDPSKSRSRVLSDDELKAIWNACEDDTYGRIVKVLMLTGQRRGEIAGVRPSMKGVGTLTLPGWLTKNGREHIIPLFGEAEILLKANVGPLEPILGVWSKDEKRVPFSAWSKNKKLLDDRCGVSEWTLHDLRRTFRTGLGKQGVRPDIAERVVNHLSSRSDMEEVYDRHRYLPEMRQALELWEGRLLSVVEHSGAAADPHTSALA